MTLIAIHVTLIFAVVLATLCCFASRVVGNPNATLNLDGPPHIVIRDSRDLMEAIDFSIPPKCGFYKCVYASKIDPSLAFLILQADANMNAETLQQGWDSAVDLKKNYDLRIAPRGPPIPITATKELVERLKNSQNSPFMRQQKYQPSENGVQDYLVQLTSLVQSPHILVSFRKYAKSKYDRATFLTELGKSSDDQKQQIVQNLQKDVAVTRQIISDHPWFIRDFQVILDDQGHLIHFDIERGFDKLGFHEEADPQALDDFKFKLDSFFEHTIDLLLSERGSEIAALDANGLESIYATNYLHATSLRGSKAARKDHSILQLSNMSFTEQGIWFRERHQGYARALQLEEAFGVHQLLQTPPDRLAPDQRLVDELNKKIPDTYQASMERNVIVQKVDSSVEGSFDFSCSTPAASLEQMHQLAKTTPEARERLTNDLSLMQRMGQAYPWSTAALQVQVRPDGSLHLVNLEQRSPESDNGTGSTCLARLTEQVVHALSEKEPNMTQR